MNRDQKAAVIEELAAELKTADAVFAVDYRGISVTQAAELRGRLRDSETVFRIVKNSLTERASDVAGTEALKPMLEGPTALAFVRGDAALAAKALSDAARALGALEFKGGLLSGAPLTTEEVQRIARLPAREVLHGQLVGTIAAPLTGLVRTLNALIAGLAIQLGQIAEQGLVSGEAPTAPEPPAEPTSEAGAEAPSPSEAPRASEADGEAAASGASASETDAAEAEPEPAAEAEAAPEAAEPEAEPEAAAEAAPAAAADAAPEAVAASEPEQAEPADASADEPETDAAAGPSEETKEEA